MCLPVGAIVASWRVVEKGGVFLARRVEFERVDRLKTFVKQ